MKNILCVKWGDKYNGYEEKLKEQLEKHCSFDFNFYCLTDNPTKEYHIQLPNHWDEYYVPNMFWAYRKFYMFNENLFPEIEGDEFLYFDLDIIFHRSVDYFFNLDMEKPWIIRGWWNSHEKCKLNYNKGESPLVNSSVIRWNRGQLLDVYNHIAGETILYNKSNTSYIFAAFKTIDNYLNRIWYDVENDRSDLFNVFERNIIYSWYKGNTYPYDMETKKLREDHILCLFNNSSTEDDGDIEKLWKK